MQPATWTMPWRLPTRPLSTAVLRPGKHTICVAGIHWRLGDRRQAINDYHASVALNPHGPAEQALAQANEILSFFNPDIFNP